MRARRFESSDFVEFDYLLAMDHDNLADMRAIRPEKANARLQLMLEYSDRFEQEQVPDPYFSDEGFEQVYDMIDDAARGLLRQIRAQHGI